MSEYPDNSHSNKVKVDQPEKKVEKVVTGTTKARKKSEAKKFASIFVPDDMASVKSYILMDVIVPGIKNAISDAVNIMLFGETRRTSTRKSSGSKVSYQRYYDEKRDDRREYSRPRVADGFEYDDIIFETRGDAILVLESMDAAIASYGMVSVADLYDLAGVTCRSYTANKYGWTDIHNAKAVRIRDGYILQLPRTVQIDN